MKLVTAGTWRAIETVNSANSRRVPRRQRRRPAARVVDRDDHVDAVQARRGRRVLERQQLVAARAPSGPASRSRSCGSCRTRSSWARSILALATSGSALLGVVLGRADQHAGPGERRRGDREGSGGAGEQDRETDGHGGVERDGRRERLQPAQAVRKPQRGRFRRCRSSGSRRCRSRRVSTSRRCSRPSRASWPACSARRRGARWATWEELEPGRYSEGGDAPGEQPRETHPPLVSLVAFEGRPSELVERMLTCVADTLVRELDLAPGNVFVTYDEARAGRIYTGGACSAHPEADARAGARRPRVDRCRQHAP